MEMRGARGREQKRHRAGRARLMAAAVAGEANTGLTGEDQWGTESVVVGVDEHAVSSCLLV